MELLNVVQSSFNSCTPYKDYVMDNIFPYCMPYYQANLRRFIEICGRV